MKREFKAGVVTGIEELIGRTPMIHLGVVHGSTILLKLEKFNPGQSTKDRMALSIVTQAERRGELRPGQLIIESSSGNAATALAMLAAARGYRFLAVMDHHAAREKIDTVRAYGASVVLVGGDAPDGYVAARERTEEVKQLRATHPDAFFADQADNPDNPLGYAALADELREVSHVDVLIGAIASGGTLCGTARRLRERMRLHVIAVEPEGSVIFGGPAGPYLQSGAGNPPDIPIARNVDFDQIDLNRRISDRHAFNTARALACTRGILVGGSSGAAVWAALDVARTANMEQTIVVLAADGGEKYATTIFSDDWMHAQNLLDDEIADLVTSLMRR